MTSLFEPISWHHYEESFYQSTHAMVWIGVLWLALYSVAGSVLNDETRLLKALLNNHNPNARPVLQAKDPINVTFGLQIIQLLDVENREQYITLQTWVRQYWTNKLLTWKPEDWGGVTETQMNADEIWIPDIVLYNNAGETYSGGTEKYKTRITIRHDGFCTWLAPATFKSTCKIDITYFPFDKQVCLLKFGSWTFDMKGIDLNTEEKPMITGQYKNSSQWNIDGIKKKRKEETFQCCINPYVYVTFKFVLVRKPLYFVFNVILPCLLLVATILFGFLLPPESGERISLTMTILLAVTVFLQLVNETLPHNSDGIPVLAVFYLLIMFESIFSLVITCGVLAIHHKLGGRHSTIMPKWVKRIFFGTLAKWLGMDAKRKQSKPVYWINGGVSNDASENDAIYTIKSQVNGVVKNASRTPVASSNKQTIEMLEKLLLETKTINGHLKVMQKHEEKDDDWQFLARVIDRLFFWVFLLTIVLSSLATLLPAGLSTAETVQVSSTQ